MAILNYMRPYLKTEKKDRKETEEKVGQAETGEEGPSRPLYFATISVKKKKNQGLIPNLKTWLLGHQMQSISQWILTPCSSTTPSSFLQDSNSLYTQPNSAFPHPVSDPTTSIPVSEPQQQTPFNVF